ncbi:MAG: PAS domain S-box protein, partial [Bacteroidia bacterium]|nr:PAS domain S-box protein [Bacteroidia bacterium]
MPNIADPTFQEIFRSSVEAIIVVDESGAILVANPASETMFAYTEGELPGLSV